MGDGPQRLSSPPPPPSRSLTTAHITDAVAASNDHGATLVFLKKNLTDIGEEAAAELSLRQNVERIALGQNRLTTLPTAFALLSRLRYLNLKNNSFTVFPDVLTLLPALDTLDISHNKIKRLPTQPGKLLNLRVFCLSRNKLSRLPIYLSKFYKLEVLQLERNPLEWPPKAVLNPPEAPGAMRDWIRSVQMWIEEAETSRHRIHDDSGFSEREQLETNIEDSYNSWANFTPVTEREFDGGVTPHARSFSIDSNFSISSIAESDSAQEDVRSDQYDEGDRPPPLHLGMLGSFSAQNSPTRSFESYLPSPADSDKFFDEMTQHPPRKDSLRTHHPPPPESSASSSSTAHARNASYASGSRDRERVLLTGKKSMPDLRTAKLSFSSRKAAAPPDLPPATKIISGHSHEDSFPSPMSLRKDSDSSGSSSVIVRPFTRELSGQGSPTRTVPPVPSMAFERNSYFRRLSKLPAATISNTLPKALLSLIDSARSILFAMCQVYQSLEHYTLHAPDDRLKSVLRKVLDPASADMMQLINSLDRFDVMSRKTLPSHAVCRGVVESCRDTVASFGKAVGVLSLQLKVLAAADDVRYLRSMLLMLYGATAEVAVAWQGMVPQIETIRPLLHPKAFPIPSPLPTADYNNGVPATAPAMGRFLATEAPVPRPHSVAVNGAGRTRARRHAGSFSSKDVEIGKKLPSYEDPPLMAGGVASHSHTPVPRAPKQRQHQYLPAPYVGTGTMSPNVNGHGGHGLPTPSASSISMAEGSSRAPPQQSHSRQGSQASLHASSSSASQSSGPSTSSSPSIPAKGTSFLDLPSSSKTQVDKEALQAIQAAVEVAPTVWDMMEQTLGDALDADVRETLDRARAVTRRLADVTRSMQEGGDGALDRKVLREDSNLFLKIVVQLSNVIKTYGGAHPTLRSNLVKLTNSTEEFAILLHVSSFSPLPSSNGRPYSPMPASPALSTTSISYSAITHPHNHVNGNSSFSSNAATGLGLGPPEEYRVASSLSRSRSAQPSPSSKLAIPPAQDQPRSALPSQSFNVPPMLRRGRTVVGEAG